MRFHLDENISGAVASGLRRRGIDISTANEAGLIGADDLEHLEYARKHNRIVVTLTMISRAFTPKVRSTLVFVTVTKTNIPLEIYCAS